MQPWSSLSSTEVFLTPQQTHIGERTPFAPGAVLLPLGPVPRDLVRDPISLQPAETSSVVLLCTWGQVGGTLMIYPQCRPSLPPDWTSRTHSLQAQCPLHEGSSGRPDSSLLHFRASGALSDLPRLHLSLPSLSPGASIFVRSQRGSSTCSSAPMRGDVVRRSAGAEPQPPEDAERRSMQRCTSRLHLVPGCDESSPRAATPTGSNPAA